MIAEALLIGLASWRLAVMVSREQGPGHVFAKFRARLGIESTLDVWPDRFLPNLVMCPWCLTVWLAVVLYGVWQVAPEAIAVIAAMAVAVMIEAEVQRRG